MQTDWQNWRPGSCPSPCLGQSSRGRAVSPQRLQLEATARARCHTHSTEQEASWKHDPSDAPARTWHGLPDDVAPQQQAAQAHTWPDTGGLERGTRTHSQGIFASAAGSRCHTTASETFTREDSWSRRRQAIGLGDRCSGRALSGAIRAFCLLVALGVQQPVRVQALPSAPSQLNISSVTEDSANISW